MRSVLLIPDQVAGRFPDRCVLTGEPTDVAIRMRAASDALPELLVDVVGGLVRLGRRVELPVEPGAMTGYRRRQSRWVGVAGAGLGLVVVGVATGALPWAGLLLLVLAVAGSARTRRAHWVQVRQKRDADEVIVLRTHPAFDEQARLLHAQALRRRPD